MILCIIHRGNVEACPPICDVKREVTDHAEIDRLEGILTMRNAGRIRGE